MNPGEAYIERTTHEQRHQLALSHATVGWRQTDKALSNLITVLTVFAVFVLPVLGVWLYRTLL